MPQTSHVFHGQCSVYANPWGRTIRVLCHMDILGPGFFVGANPTLTQTLDLTQGGVGRVSGGEIFCSSTGSHRIESPQGQGNY